MAKPRARMGIIGCGHISGTYLEAAKVFPALDIVACADLDPARALARADQYGIRALSVADLLADPTIEVVVNLTNPDAHSTVGLAALEAGKHLYNEKPLAVDLDDGRELMRLAAGRGLRIGCAPDTFLGGGLQTCRKLLDDAWIGRPVAAVAFMTCHGHEKWHPNPTFYYQVGGGPLFDMGPYYLSALIHLLGPIRRVMGAARITFPERVITSAPLYGQRIPVEVPTHVTGALEFTNGALATVIMSFDIWAADLPHIEVYGTEGTLSVPNPNTFGGPVCIRRAEADAWSEMPLIHGYAGESRGIGVADMIYALRSGRPHRASGDLAYHVLDTMHALYESSRTSRFVELESSCSRPAPLPPGLMTGTLDP